MPQTYQGAFCTWDQHVAEKRLSSAIFLERYDPTHKSNRDTISLTEIEHFVELWMLQAVTLLAKKW